MMIGNNILMLDRTPSKECVYITQATSCWVNKNPTVDVTPKIHYTRPPSPQLLRRRGSCQLVADLLVCQQVRNKLATGRCNLGNDTTQQTQQTFARANVLRTCYGETDAIMDLGLFPHKL